ncbi:MAG: hypothetical protein ACRD44_12595 [Bryobacteraceae bacterium]
MNCTDAGSAVLAQLHALEHPRYFYGQLLGVRHFESEHEYFKAKLWMLNRLVHGYGVVCGLDVKEAPNEPGSVSVMPGLALDKWGREIVVVAPSAPVKVEPYQPPQRQEPRPPDRDDGDDCGPEGWAHLVICYSECATDPEPVMAGGCDGPARCSHGTVREGYCLELRPEKADRLEFRPEMGDPFRGRPFDYGELVRWVTEICQPCADTEMDPCIPLANIRRPAPGQSITEIDIEVRPVVYSLDLLFAMMLAHHTQPPTQKGGRPYRTQE